MHPVELIEGEPLSFSIAGAHLPNSDIVYTLDLRQENVTAAALGYVCEVLQCLSVYSKCHQPYPITPRGSTSTIFDPISHHDELPEVVTKPGSVPLESENPSRVFPLYQGGAKWRFEYGVMLLNKDLEALMSSFGVRVVDPRQTLPNLRNLMNVLLATPSWESIIRSIQLADGGELHAAQGMLSRSETPRAVQGHGETYSNEPFIPTPGLPTSALHV
jgi:hypothetical protein